MKRALFVFLSVFLFGSLLSQPYQSIFGDSSTTWSLVKQGSCDDVCNAFYSPNGDTLINENNYKTLPNYGFIREDSTIGKVWFYDELWDQEFLVMDMTLNVSDGFIIYDLLGNPEQFFVDSINYQSGKKHIYLDGGINICGMEEPLVFIEGSGPNAGFNYQKTNGGGNYLQGYMLCHSKNEIKVQGNIMFLDSCEICMVGIEELENTKKEVIKICDFMGRETPFRKNTPLIYYYSDGTIKKVMVVE